MNLVNKTKEQLIEELIKLHGRVADLECRLQDLQQGKEFSGDAEGQLLGEPLEDLTKLPELKKMLQQEVDHRTRLESQLAQSEKLYRTLVETARDVIWVVDLDLKYTYVSPSVTKVLGYTVEEIMFMNPLSTMTPLSRDRIVRAFQEELALEASGPRGKYTSRTEEIEQHHKDGSTRWEEITTTFLRANDGSPIGILGISHDITERKRMEDALRASEERFRALTENASDWVWEVNADGAYTYASSKIKDMLGYEPHEVIGKTPFDLMPPEERKRVAKVFRDAVEAQNPITMVENVNLRKDGREVVLETSGQPFFHATGRLLGYRGIDRDITERKKVEEALRQARDELEQKVQELYSQSVCS